MGAVLLQKSYGPRKTWKGIKMVTFIFQASNSVSVKEISDVKARTKQDGALTAPIIFWCTELNLAEIYWFVARNNVLNNL